MLKEMQAFIDAVLNRFPKTRLGASSATTKNTRRMPSGSLPGSVWMLYTTRGTPARVHGSMDVLDGGIGHRCCPRRILAANRQPVRDLP